MQSCRATKPPSMIDFTISDPSIEFPTAMQGRHRSRISSNEAHIRQGQFSPLHNIVGEDIEVISISAAAQRITCTRPRTLTQAIQFNILIIYEKNKPHQSVAIAVAIKSGLSVVASAIPFMVAPPCSSGPYRVEVPALRRRPCEQFRPISPYWGSSCPVMTLSCCLSLKNKSLANLLS